VALVKNECAIGLGSNVGARTQTIHDAVEALGTLPNTRVTKLSNLYETPPWGPILQGPYVNACCLIETGLTAQKLLDACLDIEKSLGRERKKEQRWGPRTLDLDILTYAQESIDTDTLSVPHPRITERAFVLVPLSDIAPNLVIMGRTVSEWMSQLDTKDVKILQKDAA
jgi:2-amino-4-hydroxy-6-hydroxymethyldihydropteridine diphosphokinase